MTVAMLHLPYIIMNQMQEVLEEVRWQKWPVKKPRETYYDVANCKNRPEKVVQYIYTHPRGRP